MKFLDQKHIYIYIFDWVNNHMIVFILFQCQQYYEIAWIIEFSIVQLLTFEVKMCYSNLDKVYEVNMKVKR